MDIHIDKWMDGWMNNGLNGWMDEQWMNGWTESIIIILIQLVDANKISNERAARLKRKYNALLDSIEKSVISNIH